MDSPFFFTPPLFYAVIGKSRFSVQYAMANYFAFFIDVSVMIFRHSSNVSMAGTTFFGIL